MLAHQLNCRVTLQALGPARDAAGQPVNQWHDVADLWASICHLSGVQVIRADQTADSLRASIRIRWRDGVLQGMRVLHRGVIYTITAVMLGDSRSYIDLVCEY